jgi:hypothetical protein
MGFGEFFRNFEIFSYVTATTWINSGLNFKKGTTFKNVVFEIPAALINHMFFTHAYRHTQYSLQRSFTGNWLNRHFFLAFKPSQ